MSVWWPPLAVFTVCLSMRFCQFCFPVAFSSVRTFWLKICDFLLGTWIFWSPSGHSEKQATNKQAKPLPLPLVEHSLVCHLPPDQYPGWSWSLCDSREWPGLSSRTPCHLSRMHTGRRNRSPRCVFLLFPPALSRHREGGKGSSILSLSGFMSSFQPTIWIIEKLKTFHSQKRKKEKGKKVEKLLSDSAAWIQWISSSVQHWPRGL